MDLAVAGGASSSSHRHDRELMMSRKTGSLDGFFGTKSARTRHAAALADVHSTLLTKAPLRERFQACTDALVRHLDAAAARIWLVTRDGRALALQANSGAPTTPGGEERHVPVASPALRSIVEEGIPYITHDAVNDPYLKGLKWAPGERMAYAGYPLLVHLQLVGVLAMFSRTPMSPSTLETLCTIADMLGGAVEPAHGTSALRRSEAFLTESERLSRLLGTIRREINHTRAARNPQLQVLRDRYASLSRRERDVMDLVVAGRLNKQVGAQLGISEITVKAHRGQVMRKMKALSFADLVKIAVLLQLAPLQS
jgi:DNA-binding CsgD family transcriptional regulator